MTDLQDKLGETELLPRIILFPDDDDVVQDTKAPLTKEELSPRIKIFDDVTINKEDGSTIILPDITDVKDDLTKDDILKSDRLMEIVYSSLEGRRTPSGKFTGVRRSASLLAGADIGGLSGLDYRSMPKEKAFEIWQNYQRSFAFGQTVTVANELAYGLSANDEVRGKLGAGYLLYDKMAPVTKGFFTGEADYKEMGDATWDLARSVVADPSTVLSFGLGKIFSSAATKSGALASRLLMKNAYKAQVSKGVAKNTAARNVKIAAMNAMPFATADSLMAGGVDVLYQLQLVNTQAQTEYSLAQTGIVGLGSLFVMPTIAAGSAVAKEFRKSDILKNTFLSYKYLDSQILKVGVDSAEKELNEHIANNINIKILDDIFGLVEGDTKNFLGWNELKISSKNIIKEKGQKYTDTEATREFFKFLFLGDPVENLGGYGEVLRKAGFTVHEALIEKYGTKTAVLAQTLKFIPDEKVAKIVNKFESDTGYKLSFVDKDNKVTRGDRATAADLVAHLTWQTSEGGKNTQVIQQLERSVGVLDSMEPPSNVLKKALTKFDVGVRVIAKDRDNVGTVVSTKGNKVFVRFVNKETGAEATVPLKRNQLTPLKKDIPLEDAIKLANSEKVKDPKRLQFSLSVYKRLLTSHLATTGANVKGFVKLVSINTAADAFTAGLEAGQGVLVKYIGRNPKAAQEYFNRAYGSLGGSIRRAVDVITPDLPIQYADAVLETQPEILNKLFREVSGDGGTLQSLEQFNLDKAGKVWKVADSVTKGAQTITLVRLQDSLTKRWSFGTNLNKQIMKTYGMSPEKFFDQPDVALIMAKDKFKNVLDKAAYTAMRETASVNWSVLPGKSALRSTARWIEDQTNRSAAGFVVPFGSFLNTTIATMGDLTGVNAIAHSYRRATGKNLDYTTPTGAEDLGKMAAFYSTLVYYTYGKEEMIGTMGAKEKIANGIAWNQEVQDDGSIKLITYDWPEGTIRLMAHILAYSKVGEDGSIIPQLSEVPKDLFTQLGLQLGGQAVRDLTDVEKNIYETARELKETKRWDKRAATVLVGILSRPIQGVTRPLDPINQVYGLLTDGNLNPDRRQGFSKLNNMLKYVDNIIGSSKNLEVRAKATREDAFTPDIGKQFGTRSIPVPNIVERFLNHVSIQDYKAIKFEGPPEVKNVMDDITAPIYKQVVENALNKKENRDFFNLNKPLKDKMKIVEEVQKQVKTEVTNYLIANLPPEFNLVRVLSGKNKSKIQEIMTTLRTLDGKTYLSERYDTVQDMLKDPNAYEDLRMIQNVLENYDSYFGKDALDF